MDKTKLSVRVPRDLVEGARQGARERNTTLTAAIKSPAHVEYTRRPPG